MNVSNGILLIIGVFILILGIIWSKKSWGNVGMKLLLLASGGYIIIYALYLSGIVIIVNRLN